MVIPGVTTKTIGRYGRTSISAEFRTQALSIFRAGGGVVDARTLLRESGWRFGNQSMTELFREFRAGAIASRNVNRIRDDLRPTSRTITQTNMRFSRQFQYTGKIRLFDRVTGIASDLSVQFGDDRLLTAGEIRERIEAIGERVALQGGPDYDMEEPTLERGRITGVLSGLPRVSIGVGLVDIRTLIQ